MSKNISIIIPAYRSYDRLNELYERIVKVFNNHKGIEIIFIEDGGGDNSWEVITEIAKIDSRVHGLRLSRNYGQHNALLCGIRSARGEVIVTIDDDLQHSPEEIPKLLAKLYEGYDVVYGPPLKEQHGFARNFASRIIKMTLQGVMGAQFARHASAFRAFRTELRDAFSEYRGPMVNIDILLTWASSNFSAVRVRHEPRRVGGSGYTSLKLISHALNMMTGFSILPLRFASILGFIFALFGFFVLAYVLIGYLIHGGRVPGFPFLASVLAIFSGAQLLALGIIGEYLARIYLRSMEKPPYVVREVTFTEDK